MMTKGADQKSVPFDDINNKNRAVRVEKIRDELFNLFY